MRLVSVLVLLISFSSFSHALDKPEGKVILTVTGAINGSNLDQSAEFDFAMLQDFPQYSVTTNNPWIRGSHTYQGFSAVDLVKILSSESVRLQVFAFNGYMTEIPLNDFVEKGAIFAIKQDGQPMTIRKLGPIMVIYPFDELEELKSEIYYGRSIWQVAEIKLIGSME
ncbi:hypothetical protein MUS1_00335 [Marinomonas ushuaiensis DSM 15871]|uniref:Oxidoreductase n=1 Tax=Marinomonas ushuaiensis DSM 15871 TaxID=1122207 RepID=X7E810_9GAMM|nr:hypothetical protein [Marinomonas ushuaiensis]ETX12092.1 hypothetical protein MUS1_00335 [Marinomonas ushuaiensis DSM 15871]